MGSWNGTCFLTNLPIGGGDPVKAFILTPSPYYKPHTLNTCGTSYPTDRYKLVGLGFDGEYDGYGSVDCVKSNDVLNACVNVTEVLEVIKDGNNTKTPFALTMAHTFAYNELLTHFAAMAPYSYKGCKTHLQEVNDRLPETEKWWKELGVQDSGISEQYAEHVLKLISREELTNLALFKGLLSALRIELAPTSGQGSQATNYKLHKFKAKLISKNC